MGNTRRTRKNHRTAGGGKPRSGGAPAESIHYDVQSLMASRISQVENPSPEEHWKHSAYLRVALKSSSRQYAKTADPTTAENDLQTLEELVTTVGVAEELIRKIVPLARKKGATWSDIGNALSVPAESARKRFS